VSGLPGAVVVVGSVNADYVVRVTRRPLPGETVLADSLEVLPGGKGANQALAARRCGAAVELVACVGLDAAGSARLAELERAGIGTAAVARVATAPTGSAFITLTDEGENTIVVAAGANGELGGEQLEAARPLLAAASVVVAQLEVPMAAVARAFELAAPAATVVLNAAPYRALPAAVLRRTSVLVVNAREAGALSARPVDGPDQAVAAARSLRALGPPAVVVSLGAAGAVLVSEAEERHVPTPPVRVVDTTGAGDALVGALAARLASGSGLAEAVEAGVAVGTATAGRLGAEPVVPPEATGGRSGPPGRGDAL